MPSTGLEFENGAQLTSRWVENPAVVLIVLLTLVVLFGLRPGFRGYRWHAAALREERFKWQCTIVAESRRQAIRAANSEQFAGTVHIAAA